MHEVLGKLGLDSSEIKVYINLLELGTTKVYTISKRSAIPRTTVYGILESLIKKGLVSYVIRSGVKHYEATDPKRLLVMEQEKIMKLKKIIPSLENLKQTIGEKPRIEMYEGKEGIKSAYEDMLKTGKTIYGYGNTRLLFKLLEFYVPNYIRRRTRSGIKFQVITEKSDVAKNMKKNDRKENRETRFLNGMKNTTTVNYLYDKKIAIMCLLKKQPISIIIENKDIYNSSKVVFDIMWESSS